MNTRLHLLCEQLICRHEHKNVSFEMLEALESRIMMAADMSATMIPDVSTMAAIEVSMLSEADVDKDITSESIVNRINQWNKPQPLKLKSEQGTK